MHHNYDLWLWTILWAFSDQIRLCGGVGAWDMVVFICDNHNSYEKNVSAHPLNPLELVEDIAGYFGFIFFIHWEELWPIIHLYMEFTALIKRKYSYNWKQAIWIYAVFTPHFDKVVKCRWKLHLCYYCGLLLEPQCWWRCNFVTQSSSEQLFTIALWRV